MSHSYEYIRGLPYKEYNRIYQKEYRKVTGLAKGHYRNKERFEKLTKKDVSDILADYEGGLINFEICKKWDITPYYLRKIIDGDVEFN